jgi:hypothetical protein
LNVPTGRRQRKEIGETSSTGALHLIENYVYEEIKGQTAFKELLLLFVEESFLASQ